MSVKAVFRVFCDLFLKLRFEILRQPGDYASESSSPKRRATTSNSCAAARQKSRKV